MAYNYYCIYANEKKKGDTGTNVYAESESHAKEIGAILLSRWTGNNYSAEDMFAEVDSSIQEDNITTT